jgi:hypothetical protein
VYAKNTHASDDRTVFGYAICLTLPNQPEYVFLPLVMEDYAP